MMMWLVSLGIAIAGPTLQLESLAESAERVVVGEVLNNRTAKDEDTAWTVTTVRVLETLRGHAEPVIEVRLPGAQLPNQDLLVFGQTQLIEGHEVLLFLRGDQVVGMGAGAFVIHDNKAWKNTVEWTYADPKTSGEHAKELYVSHDMNRVRSALK